MQNCRGGSFFTWILTRSQEHDSRLESINISPEILIILKPLTAGLLKRHHVWKEAAWSLRLETTTTRSYIQMPAHSTCKKVFPSEVTLHHTVYIKAVGKFTRPAHTAQTSEPAGKTSPTVCSACFLFSTWWCLHVLHVPPPKKGPKLKIQTSSFNLRMSTRTVFDMIKSKSSGAVQATSVSDDTKLMQISTKFDPGWSRRDRSRRVPAQLTVPSQRETRQHLQEERECFDSAHARSVSHEATTSKLRHRPTAGPTLCRTFGATLTISCVRFRDFPVQLPAFFVESLQDLPHFVHPTSPTQLQVLPVQLESGAGVLYAVMGFPLNVEVWLPQKGKTIRKKWVMMIPTAARSISS